MQTLFSLEIINHDIVLLKSTAVICFIFNNKYLRLGQTICYDNYGGKIKRQLTVSYKVTIYLRVR